MKRSAKIVLGVVTVLVLSGAILAADRSEDFKSFQKSVKDNPAYEAGKEVRWFKILVTDARTNKDKVRITLPIALVEIALKCMDDTRIHLDRSDRDVDIKSLWADLKKVGPMAFIEIYEDDEIVKVWFE